MIQNHLLRTLLIERAARIPDGLLENVLGENAVEHLMGLFPPPMDLGAKVAALAHDLWESEIREPKGLHWEMIDKFIRGELGLGWTTADAKTWKPNQPYNRNHMFAWCAAFISWCWGNHGLKAEIRRKNCASTYRLDKLCRGTERAIPIEEARPGDVAIVSDGSLWYGEHVTLVYKAPEDGLITTIEGNATGRGPKGENYEGVIKRTRPLQKMPTRARCPISGRKQSANVINVWRFTAEDLAA